LDTIISWFKQRPLRMLGGLIVFFSTGLLIFLVLLDIVAGLKNPYIGIIAYMMLPGLLVFGLILVPIDLWIQRRRKAHGLPEYPVIDMCDIHQRRIVTFFSVTTVMILMVMTVVTYKSVEFMDTKTFCGKVCHKVMIPEYTAYLHSPHASVDCIQCHIGPGAPWFVRAKLSGLPQVWHYMRKDYPRPLGTPVKALRPSRDTCENCHWPQAFYGSRLRTTITYQTDQNNTRQVNSMILRVGSGGVTGSGIHSHIIGHIDYLPGVENRSEMAWIRLKRADGSVQEFVNPTYKDKLDDLRKKEAVRFMDCIDCHNRAAHEFEPFEKLLDEGITRQRVDSSIPFIKKQAMDAAGDLEKVPTESEQAQAVTRIENIKSYYQKEYPDIYKTRQQDIQQSVEAIRDIYLKTYFPHMKVGSDTYPNWRTHAGCFRCHGVMVAATPGGRDAAVSADCNLCHSDQTTGDPVSLLKK
jgi:hypothetical protein